MYNKLISITLLMTSFLFSAITMDIGVVNQGNDVYDEGEMFNDANGNDVWDDGEEFYEDTIEITIATDASISGFQFDVQGMELNGGSGGLAGDAGFDIYASGDTVLGFSLDGSEISLGSDGVLTTLYGTINDNVCLPFIQDVGPEDDTPILSDSLGEALGDISIGDDECDPLSSDGDNMEFSLFDTYPNPFNPQLSIDVTMNENDNINIAAYNLTGQYIETIYNGFAFKGEMYTFEWDASHVSSGVYIIRLESSNLKYSKVVSLLK